MGSSMTRRDLAKLVLAAAAGPSARAVAAEDPITAGGATAAVRLAEGTLGARELAETALERAGRLAHLGAFIGLDPDGVRRDADRIDALRSSGRDPGPLAGVPLAVKDNIDSSALPTTAGTPALRDWRPGADAPVLAGLLEAGAVLFGKTNMHELAFGITTNNAAFGAARNPWNPDMIPGGSSGGSAVAVAAGIVPWALGSDTGGSCRIPAALCGCVGFRPTLDRYPQTGVVPISHSRDTVGTLARRVADVVVLDLVIAGEEEGPIPEPPPARDLRFGVPRRFFFEDLDPALETVVEGALDRLAAAGVTLVELDLSAVPAVNERTSFPLALFEVLRELAIYLASHGNPMSVITLVEAIAGKAEKGLMEGLLGEGAIPPAVYRRALAEGRPELRRLYAEAIGNAGVDALILPTTPLPARPIGQEEMVELRGREVPTFPTYIRNTDPPSVAGLPAISLPAGLTADRLPVGMELVGLPGSDRRLLAVAATVESVLGPLPEPPV